jgi:orotidine-5'-phosphate decarboxylase
VNRILVALDVPTATEALALADTLRGSVGGFKIGSQLFTAAGPEIVRTLVARGDRVFLDLKFHDIPNTVAGAIRSSADLGVWMVNVHASGGRPMMDAARKAADDHGRGVRPLVIAVTVLTSLDAALLATVGIGTSPIDQAVRLAELARASGLDGVVASPQETEAIRRACGNEFLIVTPGIRGGSATFAGAQGAERGVGSTRATEPGGVQGSPPIKDDQRRTLTPAEAVAAGSSYLVVGRPITAAVDPRQAAEAIAASTSPSR